MNKLMMTSKERASQPIVARRLGWAKSFYDQLLRFLTMGGNCHVSDIVWAWQGYFLYERGIKFSWYLSPTANTFFRVDAGSPLPPPRTQPGGGDRLRVPSSVQSFDDKRPVEDSATVTKVLKVVPKLSVSCTKVVSRCPKGVWKLSQRCLKVVPKLSQSCPKVVSKLSQRCCFKVVSKCPKGICNGNVTPWDGCEGCPACGLAARGEEGEGGADLYFYICSSLGYLYICVFVCSSDCVFV